jgi:hypothetical protein
VNIGRMHFRNAFALAPISVALLGWGAPAVAFGDTPKEACLSAADQGQSLRDEGKYGLARDQFQICARDACPKLVHDQCTEWLRQLDDSMPTVVFGAKDDQGADVSGARVLIDGKEVSTGIDGKPVSLDPGAHEVRFERDTPSQSVALHVVLRTGEKNREVTGTFPAPEVTPVSPESPPATPTIPPPAPPLQTDEGQHGSNVGRNAVSITLLGAGVVGLGLGAFFGLQSQNDKSDAAGLRAGLTQSECQTPSASPTCQQLSDKVDAQNRDALVSDIMYVAGGVFAAGAVATFFLWPTAGGDTHAATSWVAPFVEPTRAGVRVGGTF